MSSVYRTHTCGQLRPQHVGQEARLSGWVQRKRDHGNLLFIDLRDHYGVTQVVIDASSPVFKTAEAVRTDAEIGVPHWQFAAARYAVAPDGSVSGGAELAGGRLKTDGLTVAVTSPDWSAGARPSATTSESRRNRLATLSRSARSLARIARASPSLPGADITSCTGRPSACQEAAAVVSVIGAARSGSGRRRAGSRAKSPSNG